MNVKSNTATETEITPASDNTMVHYPNKSKNNYDLLSYLSPVENQVYEIID